MWSPLFWLQLIAKRKDILDGLRRNTSSPSDEFVLAVCGTGAEADAVPMIGVVVVRTHAASEPNRVDGAAHFEVAVGGKVADSKPSENDTVAMESRSAST